MSEKVSLLTGLPNSWGGIRFKELNNGDIFAAGFYGKKRNGHDEHEVWVRKYGENGILRWHKKLNLYDATLHDIAAGKDGSITIVGGTNPNVDDGRLNTVADNSRDYFIANIDESGSLRWLNLLRGDASDSGQKVISLNQGGYMSIWGKWTQVSGTWKNVPFLIKYDSNGRELWKRRMDPVHTISQMVGDENDSAFVLTRNNLPGNWPEMLVKYDRNGAKLWSRNIANSNQNFWAQAIDIDSSGSVYVGGTTDVDLNGEKKTSEGYNGYISKYDRNGIHQWTRLLGGLGVASASELRLQEDGSILAANKITGYSDGNGKSISIVKFLPDGNLVGTHKIDPTSVTASGQMGDILTIDDDGSILIEAKQYEGIYKSNIFRIDSINFNQNFYSITPEVSSINEGGEVRTNVSTTGVAEGTRLWTISGKGIDAKISLLAPSRFTLG